MTAGERFTTNRYVVFDIMAQNKEIQSEWNTNFSDYYKVGIILEKPFDNQKDIDEYNKLSSSLEQRKWLLKNNFATLKKDCPNPTYAYRYLYPIVSKILERGKVICQSEMTRSEQVNSYLCSEEKLDVTYINI